MTKLCPSKYFRSEVEPVYADDKNLLEAEGVVDGAPAIALLNISLEHAWVAEVEPDNGMVKSEFSLVNCVCEMSIRQAYFTA